MPQISAFRGLRYNLGQVGSLSSVVAPPYDVIDPELQQQLYDANEYNVVRLILNKDEPGDDDNDNRYTRAAKLLKQWQRDGALFTEADPAIYVYHQHYTANGQEYTRRGFMCRCRLERFGEGDIYPHEETHGGAKADRLRLWKACRANLSQIFGLYPDNFNQAQVILEAAVAGHAPHEATDHLGVVNQLWPVTDLDSITMLESVMAQLPIYIADGHHRYETACNYRDEVAAAWREQHGEDLPEEHPANFVLMMCVSMSDPGMQVLPTHRLFRGLPAMTSAQLVEKLGDSFDTEPAGNGPDRAIGLWEEIETEDEQGTMAFYTAEDDAWTIARLTEAGEERLAAVASDRSDDWRGLGVSILHRLVVDTLLDAPNLPAPKYVRALEEVPTGLKEGDSAGRDLTGQQGSGGRFELGCLVMPATVEHIRQISSNGERMPAKSTYFYPKVLSGLVINPLE
ncbi:DUF1015 domain-containing protein [Aeoliella sp. ICT_H6.2]|uniref:DUF1015 domain-containing protein n=1 Tax=Aeoliella straminimaris TaxID=2954799 RepID=A0A9X2JE17_9BACT|nr:DUF1015 domain-containing protein [Aeoliella straminimaris]MCO6042505.1 DUF1015 domain-containing protein [Aeoliella straminimaris]